MVIYRAPLNLSISPSATLTGFKPVAKSNLVDKLKAEPRVLALCNTEILFPVEFVATISGLPSTFNSPMSTEVGDPAATIKGAVRLRFPLVDWLINTYIVLSAELARTRSSFPSIFKSPTATSLGLDPVLKILAAANEKAVPS